MQVSKIPFSKTGAFSSLFMSYLENTEELRDFYTYSANLNGLENCSQNYNEVNRKVLVDVLKEQHASLPNNEKVLANIDRLSSSQTFTVTTGHQLNLFTGPLFFIYKIITTIKLCEHANQYLEGRSYVPVYWMATEDHDFLEINHFHLFGKKHEWSSEQEGAVGEFILEGLRELLPDLPQDISEFFEFYKAENNLASAMRALVHSLFQEYGLIIIDANNSKLKSLFADEMKQELQDSLVHQNVIETNARLQDKGLKAQVNPREINLFYLSHQSRERIEKSENGYRLVQSGREFSEAEITEELDRFPERFSPNVLLRPVYQQKILPNVSYVGGPGELAYWVQLKTTFSSFGVDYPVLMPRNFALVINKAMAKKVAKLPIELEDLFLPIDALKKRLMASLNEEVQLDVIADKLKALGGEVEELLGTVDASLKPFVQGEFKKIEKQILTIEKKGNKALERKNQVGIQQLMSVKEKLFPEGGLQERHDNFLNFYVNEKNFITDLHAILDPLDFSFNVITYDQ